MRDVASEGDARGIQIQRVGVRDLALPIMVREKSGRLAHLLGTFDASVELPHTERGTHMSRFVSILSRWSKKAVSAVEMEQMVREMAQAFDAPAVHLSLSFRYFLEKCTPATGQLCQTDYVCRFDARINQGEYNFELGVRVPIMTVCPCSKEISDEGAHSQRALLTVNLRALPGVIIWLEDLIPLLEKQGSCDLYPLLKRADEKWVTETAFAHPKFVEDVVRDTVLALRGVAGVVWFSAECEAQESIHNHVAYAYAESE
ncbi:MAG: GTP cyclohydrolase I FolE2 [Armatimonadetes bacterium]|nr:GTP cyclohydrolase I FolE2 [Armatimonadota bacterium]